MIGDKIRELYVAKSALENFYILYTESPNAIDEISSILSELAGINNIRNSGKYQEVLTSKFGIKESHMLRQLLCLRSERMYIIVATNSISLEAQNALLKTTEEINPNNHLIIVLPNGTGVLSTLESRATILTDLALNEQEIDIHKFISSTISQRLRTVEEISKQINKEDKSAQRAQAIRLVRSLESYIHMNRNQFGKEKYHILDNIDKSRRLLESKEVSIRSIMEYLCLSIPSID